MFYQPIGVGLLLLFLFLLALLVIVVEVRLLAYAYRKIGVNPRYVFAVLLLTLLGSHVNLPLYSIPVAYVRPPQVIERFGRAYMVPPVVEPSATVVAINVGGALIPVLVSLYPAMLRRIRRAWLAAYGATA